MDAVFWGFSVHAWITIVTVLAVFSTLIFTKMRADIVFLGAMGVLFVTGVLKASDAFSGFSDTSVIVVGVLFFVVAGLMQTGVMPWIVKHLMGQPKTYSRAIVRLMLPVAGLSAFLSNTTVVAMFVGVVKMWAKKLGIAPSKLLIPLSYASGMGGICTLVGTPPNLIISGLYTSKTGEVMNVLSPTIPGLFCLAVGILSVIAMRKLLPERVAPESHAEEAANAEEVVKVGFKTFLSAAIMVAMVVLSALEVMPLLQCAILAAAAMLVCRCCTTDQAMDAVEWDILMVFAGSVALGLAIQNTGVAERMAKGLLSICGSNPIVVMAAVCLVATFVTEFISNTAAGAMFFPIMYEAAHHLGYEPLPFMIALMIAVSSSFATPIGSPTHMLVYGPGGYRFTDFARIGIPMNLIILAANIFIVCLVFPLTPIH